VNPEEYDRIYRLEDRYWWFVGRRRLAIKLLHRFLPPSDFPTPYPLPTGEKPLILDLGCGTGAVLQELQSWSDPVGLDFSARALEFCRSRKMPSLLKGRGEALPITTNSMAGIVALDVFEHIEDHAAAFAEANRILAPGGILVLSVPAFRSLWGPHDVALHHFRRYTAREIRAQLEAAGFEIERLSYSVFFLFPLVWLIRQKEKFKKGPAEASLPTVPLALNKFLIRLQAIEASLILRFPLPWGSSVVAVARKHAL
jgi:SAM-dependent methyltransferase